MKPFRPILFCLAGLSACASSDSKSDDASSSDAESAIENDTDTTADNEDDTPNYGPVEVGMRELAMDHNGVQREQDDGGHHH